MRSLLLAVLILCASAIGATLRVTGANGCSCGPDCDSNIDDADLIVEGRINSWARVDGYPKLGDYLPIAVDLQVSRTFKGSPAAEVTLVNGASLYPTSQDGTKTGWGGSGGACGSFDEDPTGLYLIAGVYRDEFGNYRMNRTPTMFLGRSASGPNYEFAVARAARAIGAPSSGNAKVLAGTGTGGGIVDAFEVGFIAVGVIMLAAGFRHPSG